MQAWRKEALEELPVSLKKKHFFCQIFSNSVYLWDDLILFGNINGQKNLFRIVMTQR